MILRLVSISTVLSLRWWKVRFLVAFRSLTKVSVLPTMMPTLALYLVLLVQLRLSIGMLC